MPGEPAPKEDCLLDGACSGGFIGSARDCGVPGTDGAGEAGRPNTSGLRSARWPKSGGAGLFEEGRRSGRSMRLTLLCCDNVNWPSFDLSL